MATEIEDDEKGKLFVGALSWETSDESLHRYFSRFGKVIDCVVMINNETGRSRGFGFVTFADPNNVNYVLQSCPHTLDGRTIDPKPCNPRSMQKQQLKKGTVSYPKIFLGGLPSNVTETDLRTFFGRYGKVMEVVIMYDQEKKKSRGFGFLSFEDEAAVDRVTNDHYINLNGKQVEIKKAEPRDIPPGPSAAAAAAAAAATATTTVTATVHGMNNKIHNNDMNQWNHPQQHQGISIRPTMATANMMQGGYQGAWGASQQQAYGNYGAGGSSGNGPNPSPLSFPGWGGPPGTTHHPQAPLPPSHHAWSTYVSTTQQTPQFTNNFAAAATGTSGAGGTAGSNTWKTVLWSQNSGSVNSTDIYARSVAGLAGGGLTPSAAGGPSSQPSLGAGLSSIIGGPSNTTTTTKLQADYNAGGYGAAPPYGGNYLNDHQLVSSSSAAAAYGQRPTFGSESSHSLQHNHLYQLSQIQGNGF